MDTKSLHEAIQARDTQAVSNLLTLQTDVNAKDSKGRTPLYLAVELEARDILKQLLDAGADVNLPGDDGSTVLHLLARKTNLSSIDLATDLLAQGADLDALDGLKNTPLQVAALSENARIFRLLLNNGALVNSRCSLGRSALHTLALSSEFTAAAELATDLLIGRLGNPGADVSAKDVSGNTPLHLAAKAQNAAVFRLLLNTGMDVNVKNNYGHTALHYLVSCDSSTLEFQLVTEMLKPKYNANVNVRDDDGNTPLHLAVSTRNLDIVKLLLQRGADPDAEDNYGCTPLINAIEKKNVDLVQILIDYGADVNACHDSKRGTPLQVACNFGRTDVIKRLLENGANPNVRDRAGDTVLLDQMRHRNPSPKLVKLLLESGSDVNMAITKQDENILCFMPEERHWKIILEHIAKLMAFDLPVHMCLIGTISQNTDFDAYFTKCSDELLKAKNTRLCHTSVTFFDLLTDDRHELVKYSKTKYLVEDLKHCYREKFPIYGGSMFKNVTREIYLRFLWTQSAKKLSNLFPIFTQAYIIRDILGCLGIKELEKFCWS